MFWATAGIAIRLVLQTVVVIVLARLLSAREFGVVTLALVVANFTETFTEVGLAPALVQRKDLEQAHVNAAFTFSCILGLAIALVVALLSPLLAVVLHEPLLTSVLVAMSAVFLLKGPSNVTGALMERDLHYRTIAAADLAAYFVGFAVVGIGGALAGWGVWALVAANVVAAVTQTVLLLIFQPYRLRFSLALGPLRDLLSYGRGVTLSRIINYFGLQGDNLVVGRTMGSAALGIYSRAYQLMALPANLFSYAAGRVVFSAYARVKDDRARVTEAYRRGLAMTALVLIPASAIAAILSHEVIRILLGPKWGAVEAPFALLVLGMFFRTAYKVSGSLSLAMGAAHRNAALQGVYATVVVVGCLIGSRWGTSGVAVAVLAAVALHYVLMSLLAMRLTGMPLITFLAAHRPGLTMAVAMCATTWPLVSWLRDAQSPTLLTFAGGSAVAGVTALVLAFLAPALVLGKDGRWWLGTLRDWTAARVPALRPRPAQP
jgi:PST family polysaccharide transporter